MVQLPAGKVSVDYLRTSLLYAAQVLETVYSNDTRLKPFEDDEFTEAEIEAMPDEVREWLQSTFTHHDEEKMKKEEEKPKFKGIASAIRVGIAVDKMMRTTAVSAGIKTPEEVLNKLRTADNWDFNVFELSDICNDHALRYLSSYAMVKYEITNKFKVNNNTLDAFLVAMEDGYRMHGNPYHNIKHAADVLQTMHYLICQCGIQAWLSDLEIFACLVAAIIHDFEHTGTTNGFHVQSESGLALLYNDKTVLENYHLSAVFKLIKDKPETNIFCNMNRDDYRKLRSMVVDMVMSTDMSFHSQKVKEMKQLLKTPEHIDKVKALSYALHACDISHAAKPWSMHSRWSDMIFAEYFAQGDREADMGLPISPLCDRNKILLPQSQIGYIDFVVEPTWIVCGDMIDRVIKNVNAPMAPNGSSKSPRSPRIRRPWTALITENKNQWVNRRDGAKPGNDENKPASNDSNNDEKASS